MGKRVLYRLLILVVLVLSTMIYFYWGKIEKIPENPEKYWGIFLDATKLPEFLKLSTVTTLGLCMLAILIDLFTLGWKKSGLRRLVVKPSGSAKIDWWSFFLTVTRLYDVIHFVVTMGIFYFLAGLFVKYMNFNLGQYIGNVYVQFAVIFLATDLKTYLGHRFMHVRPLWELHAFHHSAEEFNLITATRGHIFETSVQFLFAGFFFALFGAPLEDIFIVGLISEIYQYFLHSDVNWRLGWVGKYVLISPAAHRLHHSIDSKDYNKNFGTFFIWWDRLFGTYSFPNEDYRIGIEDNPYNELGYFRGQWVGFLRFLGVNSEK